MSPSATMRSGTRTAGSCSPARRRTCTSSRSGRYPSRAPVRRRSDSSTPARSVTAPARHPPADTRRPAARYPDRPAPRDTGWRDADELHLRWYDRVYLRRDARLERCRARVISLDQPGRSGWEPGAPTAVRRRGGNCSLREAAEPVVRRGEDATT